MDELDIELIKFYYQVIRDEIAYNSDSINKKCLKKVTDAYKRRTIFTKISDIRFDSSAMRSAYVYEYGPCTTSTVFAHFLEVLRKNSWMTERMIRQDSITVCCLGGGPAMEVVAIAKALEKMICECLPKRHTPLKINAIVMDNNRSWAVTAGNVIHFLPQFLQKDLMQFHLYFLETDLRKPLTDDVKEVIKKCDIVTMVKFLSIDQVPNAEDNKCQVIKEIVQCIQDGGMLFFMDAFRCSHYEFLKKTIDSLQHIIKVYGPIDHVVNRMSLLSMGKCLKLYSKHYGWRYCCLEWKSCVCAWYRKVS